MNPSPPRHTKLLVLDLDETLIHARGRSERDLPWPPHRRVAQYRVWLRPGVGAFMDEVLDRFVAVGVWTSATMEYAVAMLERVVDRKQLRFIYARDRCVQGFDADARENYWVKDIAELDGFGFDAHQILVVDDKPRGLERSLDNLVQVPPFEGDPEDRVLDQLLPVLDDLGRSADVRELDTRGWWLRHN